MIPKNEEKIIEKITNEKGTAIKFCDGTMICTKSIKYENIQISSVWGALYQTSISDIYEFAEEFAEIPTISVTATLIDNNTPFLFSGPSSLTTKSCKGVVICHPKSVTTSFILNIIAVGKWK